MIIVLDNIRSAFNVGSVMRTCDAVGSSLVTVGYTPKPIGETRLLIKKTAINAEEYIETKHFDHALEVINFYSDYTHIALELFTESVNIFEFLNTQEINLEKVCLWFGNEINGVNPELKEHFDHSVLLPMLGKKESLNVSNAVTAVSYLLMYKYK